MSISKKLREQVRIKYNGLCAYTGLPLDDKWQADHVLPKCLNNWLESGYESKGMRALENIDCIENLVPALRIVNHYKRSLDLEGFRNYMLTFHIRYSKLPRKTTVQRTVERIAYMNKISEAFGITKEKPFNGIFYFETIINP